MGCAQLESFAEFEGRKIGFHGRLAESIDPDQLMERCSRVFGSAPSAFLSGPDTIETIGIVSGAGSTWTINGDLYVGFQGAGRWTLSDGGRVVVSGDLFRGLFPQRPRTPQTIIRLSGSNDYPEAAISVAGIADGFDPRVELIDGFLPKVGDTFLIATAGLGVGIFDFELPNLPSPLLWQVQQDTNTVTLHVRRLGDVDGDGAVGHGDLKLLLSAWGPCPDCDNCLADLDGDCAVAVPDLLTLLANWG